MSRVSGKEIVLFDEPTSGLDAHNMRRTAQIMKEPADEGRYVITVSHDIEFLNLICDRVYELRTAAGA